MSRQPLVEDLCFVEETASTSSDMLAALRDGRRPGEGSWIIAERQLAGRGRQGRGWLGAPGNFTGSTLVRLTAQDPPATTLSLVAALAVYEAVGAQLPAAGTPALRLKWPNDVELGGAKLSGILLEREGEFAVIGIGVNLAAAPPIAGRRTASLADLGPAPDRTVFAHDLARHFACELDRWRSYGAEAIIGRWLAAAHPLGTPLAVHDGAGAPVSGTFAGLEPDGALRLRLPGGAIRIVRAGNVEAGGS